MNLSCEGGKIMAYENRLERSLKKFEKFVIERMDTIIDWQTPVIGMVVVVGGLYLGYNFDVFHHPRLMEFLLRYF